MKFFQNRFVATIIAALVVVGSTAASAGIGLSRSCREAENAFFTAKSGKAPGYYVDQCISSATGLCTVAGHYNDAELDRAARELDEARDELAEAYGERDISDIYEAMQSLNWAAGSFRSTAEGVSLSENDRSAYEDAMARLAGAWENVEESSYNKETGSFLRVLRRGLPALWVEIFDIDEPELYAREG